ncbi:MAG: MBOAT family O-acyltransferase [Bacteroidota bacterium]|nr:MBOAT family O-acyltransferase [Bacteroidota bacterium]
MLFNSLNYAIFLPVVYLLYWFVFNRNITVRNVFLLIVSYIFYAFWDWRFVSLIILSSFVDFFIGLGMKNNPDDKPGRRKTLLILSLAFNFGILGFFKYYNFFVDSFIGAFSLFGKDLNFNPLKIILPVGVSFYTFQSLSYTIDVYNKKFEPTTKVINFLAFVCFFPQLVAGPIERAKHLLPQFGEKKVFDYETTRSGLLLIAYGLFKKILIADRIAIFTNGVYKDLNGASGISMLIATLFFAFQLYLDFSAYSDIAIGTARLFGFKLVLNFRRPYFSSSFSEFWTRWHISLSSWFRDYVYFPLGGSRRGSNRTIVNVMIVFLLSGLWHGASWNFVIWGGINGLFVVVLDRIFKLENLTGFKRILGSVLVVLCWTLSLVFFRAPNLHDAMYVLQNMNFSGLDSIYKFGLNSSELNFAFYLIAGMMLFELLVEKRGEILLQRFYATHFILRWSVYLALVLSVIYLGSYGSFNDNSFIYFQF